MLRRASGRTSVESAWLQWRAERGWGDERSSSGRQWGAAGRGGGDREEGCTERACPGPCPAGVRPQGIAWGAWATPLCVRSRCPGTRQQQAGAAPLPLTPYPHPRPLSSWAPGATLGTLGRRAGSLAPSRAQGSQEMPCGPTDREEIAEAWETPSSCLSQRPGGRPLTALAPAPRVAPAPVHSPRFRVWPLWAQLPPRGDVQIPRLQGGTVPEQPGGWSARCAGMKAFHDELAHGTRRGGS